MNPILTAQEAAALALVYRAAYMQSSLQYQVTGARYLPGENRFSSGAVWEITFDMENWDDAWFSIILSDAQREVLCCSSAWEEVFYPHIAAPKRPKKLPPRERRRQRKMNEPNL